VTKQDFVDAVAKRAGISEEEATKAVEAVLDAIGETLASQSLTWKWAKSRDPDLVMTNPATEETMEFEIKAVPSAWTRYHRDHRWAALSAAAGELLEDAEELERSHEKHAGRIEDSRRKLREIVQAT
jgi:hypothetical protein